MTRFPVCLALVAACGSSTPATTATTTTPTARTTTTAAAVVSADPIADSWMTAPEDQYLKAADCPSFKTLPAQIMRSTFVDAPCVEIAGTVTLAQDANLVIIATRKLRIGDGAKIIGKGKRGTAGTPAPTTTKDWTPPGPDQSARINCACRGVRCQPGWDQCAAGEDAALRGGHGGNGLRGASLFVVARELIVGSGVSVDVSGGLGGEAGTSGHVDCHYGAMSCASPAASSYGDGEGGATGATIWRAALPTALPMMIALERVTTPPSAVSKQVADTVGSFKHAIEEARQHGAAYERW